MNQQKEKMLIVAPFVPAWDQASGDLRFFTILKILCEPYQLFLIVLNNRADNIDEPYINTLKEMGIIVLGKDCSIKQLFHEHDIRFAFFEFYPSAEYYLKTIRILSPQCRIIIDSVDVHYYRYMLKYKLTKDSEDLELANKTKKTELMFYKNADVVVAVTQEDADVIKKDASSVETDVIPNIHSLVKRSSLPENKMTLLFVGSFNHLPNVDAMEYFCQNVFPRLIKRYPLIKLQIVGGGVPNELKRFESDQIQFCGFVPDVTPYLQQNYISIAPLRYGAGMKGKIGEAMAHGVPVVTTSIGVQGLALTHNVDVMVGDDPASFVDCIEALIENDDLYHSISSKAYDFIEQNFTPDIVGLIVLRVIKDVQQKPVKKLALWEKSLFILKYGCNRFVKKLLNKK